MADESVVSEIEVTVNSRDVAVKVFVVETFSISQLLLRSIGDRRQVVAKWIELRLARFVQTVRLAVQGKWSTGQSVILLCLRIHDVAIELETLAEDLVTARNHVHRLFDSRDGRGKSAEVKPCRILARREVARQGAARRVSRRESAARKNRLEPAIAPRRYLVIRQIDQDERAAARWSAHG